MSLPKPYYQDEWVQIFHGDCRDILPELPKVDLVLTDPPYGIGADVSAHKAGGKNGWKDYGDTNWDIKPAKVIFDAMLEISKNQIIWGGNYFTDYLPPSMGWLVWDKGQRDFSLADGELAWTSFWNALRIYTVPRGRALQDGKQHPTQKSLEIMNFSILYADKNNGGRIESILDPFLGSGTTVFSAKKLNRKCIGIEIEEKYCEIAAKRCSQSVMRLDI